MYLSFFYSNEWIKLQNGIFFLFFSKANYMQFKCETSVGKRDDNYSLREWCDISNFGIRQKVINELSGDCWKKKRVSLIIYTDKKKQIKFFKLL